MLPDRCDWAFLVGFGGPQLRFAHPNGPPPAPYASRSAMSNIQNRVQTWHTHGM